MTTQIWKKEIKVILVLSIILAFIVGLDLGGFLQKLPERSLGGDKEMFVENKGDNNSATIEKYVSELCGGLPANRVGSDCGFFLSTNGYAGWQMGCNYARGSNADWNEQNQKYGDQMYLTCANGLDYARVKFNRGYIK